MPSQPRDLQIALRERFRRLMTSTYQTIQQEAGLVRDWINKQAPLRALLSDAERVEPDLSAADWIESLPHQGTFTWASTTEAGRAHLAWNVLNYLAENGPDYGITRTVGRSSNMTDRVRSVTEEILQPLFDYLGEQVGTESSVLHTLQRWIRRVEWFDRDALHEEFLDNTRRGEKVYDLDLRKFMFDQGFNMPFTQARGASGDTDLLGDLDSDDPLLCEVKVFDADNRGISNIAKGVNQAYQYALDYQQAVAYLVVANISGRPLQFPTDHDGAADSPAYIEIDGVRVYLLAARALPNPSASKQPKANPVSITRDQLINPDA